MNALLRLLFLVPLGFIFACAGAGWTVAFGVYGISFSADVAGYVFATAMLVTFWTGTFTVLPVAAAVLLSEIFGWRSILFWLGLGGGLGLVGYEIPFGRTALPGDNDYLLAFVAAGFVGGFVYWVFAGRLAGLGLASGRGSPAA